MKRWFSLLLIVFLVGCSDNTGTVSEGLTLRQKLLQSNGCAFDANICASYSDCSYVFTLHCIVDAAGDLAFTVTDPESISGISGTITSTGGDLRFDDTVLGFDPIAGDLISPVGAPWLFLKTLRGGYFHASQKESSGTVLIIDDSYRQNSVRSHILVNQDLMPVSCELYWEGKRYLSIDVLNFTLM